MSLDKKYILADRDGTLIVEKNYLSDPAEVELIPGVAEAIATFNEAGWEVICVSNQSGIGRGYFTSAAVVRVNQRVQELLAPCGARILEFYFCPDTSEVESTHRKPAPGMALDAAKAYGFDLRSAIVVGDKLCDIQLGENIRATSVLVRTGYGSATEQEQGLRPDLVIDSFADLPAILLEPGENHAKLGTGR
ncbi:MAG: HAD family hydrolase [Armatimonadota bacterium]